MVNEFGAKSWRIIAQALTRKTGKHRNQFQCRARWLEYLTPLVKNSKWSNDEVSQFFDLHLQYGNKWSRILQFFKHKTTNSLRNLYYGTLRRNLRRFNKIKGPDERISGDFSRLMKIPEIRKILTARKEFSMKKVWMHKKLSNETLTIMRNDSEEHDYMHLEIQEIRLNKDERTIEHIIEEFNEKINAEANSESTWDSVLWMEDY
jgi:hypothetical protein